MNKHKAVVMGRVLLKRYYYCNDGWFGSLKSVNPRGKFKENKVIWSGELDNPPIKEDEKLYISELKTTVLINSREKSTEGGYIYWSDHVEMIEDDETERTKKLAFKHQQEDEEMEKVVIVPETKKRWWEFWK
jgi:hypothetical protein